MKRRLLALWAILCLLAACLLTGCSPAPQKYSAHSFDSFDTATTISGYADSQEEFDRVADWVLEELAQYHKLYNIYLRYEGMENLCTINDLTDGAHRTVTVDQKIIDLLVYAREMHTLTDGMVNVAMGSVLKLWHDHRTVGMDDPVIATLPPADALEEAAQHTDITKMVIDEQACTVTLTDPAMRLDVGAIAKGYAVERIARELEAQGVTGYVLNVGGNVRTIGGKPEGDPWTVGLENPQDTAAEPMAYLQLSGQALVTSGSYQRYYLVDGKRYHHIIHPDTRMPAEGWLSVSILCHDSGLGDALSTALFCMTAEEGKALVESLPDVEALWVDADGVQTTSNGWTQLVQQ